MGRCPRDSCLLQASDRSWGSPHLGENPTLGSLDTDSDMGGCLGKVYLGRCSQEVHDWAEGDAGQNMVTDESQATGSTGAGPALQRCPQLRPRGCPCFQFLYHPVIGCRKSPRRSLWQRAVPSGGYSCPPATDVSSSWGTNA